MWLTNVTSFYVTAVLKTSWKHQRRSDDKLNLSKAELETALDDAILSKGSAEIALIYLVDRYEFDLDALKARLVGIQFESSSLV